MAKKPNPQYVAANVEYLHEVAAEADTHTLPKGLLYKVVTTGEGSMQTPRVSDVVTVHYRGTLINGKEFDSTHHDNCPATFRLREVIEGWQIALQRMHVGDKWMIYIPSDMGYGNRTVDTIPGGSTLLFEVELLSIS